MALRKSSLGLVATLLAANIATVDAFWRMSCSIIQTGRIDPVVSFNNPSSHVHKISGAANININSTYASLRASSCTSCSIQADLSAYWTPQFYYAHANGTYEEVPNGGMAVYYLGRGVGADGSGAIPFPVGLQMLSGNTSARAYDSTTMTWGNSTYPARPVSDRVSFVCIGGNTPQSAGITNLNCPNGWRAQIQMQSCWDGVNLKSADQSHVAYLSQIDNGACPPSHPHLLPHLFYEVLYSMDQISQTDGHYIFSNGDTTGYGFHGDFINGWDIPTLQAGINQCLVANTDGVVEECAPLNVTNNDNFASYCTERSPVWPCEQVHGLIPSLPGCSTSTGGLTTCPGGPEACAANYQTYGTRVYPGNSQFTSMGCYTDAGGSRALTGKSFTGNKSLTAEGCLQYCQGYKYAGMEYGQECYCGNSIASTAAVASSGDCNMDCAGNRLEFCGGPVRLNMYQAVSGSVAPTSAAAIAASSTTAGASTATSASVRVVSGNSDFAYYACVNEPSSGRALPTQLNTASTVEACLTAAAAGQYAWAGLEYGGQCFVGSASSLNHATSPNASTSACKMPCNSATSEICGGPNLLTMYTRTSPMPAQPSVYPATAEKDTYMGCYAEPSNGRVLTAFTYAYIANDNMTVPYCLASAKTAGYKYAGVEYGRECWVGNTVNPNSAKATDQATCNMVCGGNSLEYCGGSSRINLYQLS